MAINSRVHAKRLLKASSCHKGVAPAAGAPVKFSETSWDWPVKLTVAVWPDTLPVCISQSATPNVAVE